MRKTIAVFAIVIAFAAAMSPVAMANIRVLHLCCPEAAKPASQHAAMGHDCDDMAPASQASLRSDMSDCSRHMVSTAAPGVVHQTSPVVVRRPQAAHPILDEFVPLFAHETNQSSQKDRAPPAVGR